MTNGYAIKGEMSMKVGLLLYVKALLVCCNVPVLLDGYLLYDVRTCTSVKHECCMNCFSCFLISC